jgi:tRNA (guanine37-N1)-methyltransferase
MKIHVITLFPEMFQALNYGIPGRALKRQLLQLQWWNPRDFTSDVHHTVDDRPYGGGPGMVMKVAPLRETIQAAQAQMRSPAPVIYLSPQGRPLQQQQISTLAGRPAMILLCGRYEGVDQRLIDSEVDEIYSVGDYVVSGGELPAMILIDALCRLLPEALGDAESAAQDSFSQGLLDHPHYTRPAEINGLTVPSVLLHGDHHAISRWRMQQSLKNTWQIRPDLIKIATLSKEQQQLLDEIRQSEEQNNAK